MARRGRCRCGFVLQFYRGVEGYKTRCPECGANVRLRGRSRKKVRIRAATCECGYQVFLPRDNSPVTCPSCARTITPPEPPKPETAKKASKLTSDAAPKAKKTKPRAKPVETSPADRAGASGLANEVGSGSSSGLRRAFADARGAMVVACSACSTIVPTQAERCPACGAATVRQAIAPSQLLNSGPRPVARIDRDSSKLKLMLGWAGAIGALLIVAGIILLMLLWH